MTTEIAIIDSGINPWHGHVGGAVGGLTLDLDANGSVTQGADFSDALGHGTAIAGIIRERSAHSRLCAIKIFHDQLSAPAVVLLEGLRWAIEQNIKIIHLSLGSHHEGYRNELKRLCQRAYDRNIVVLAAARTPDDWIYPSVFDTVIGVYWNRSCSPWDFIHHPGHRIEFGAWGQPLDLPGMPPENNFRGHSFAVARVTARAAELLDHHPTANTTWVRKKLAELANP